jgi:cytochrome c oxidase cbb3-type subunit 3
MMSKAWSIYVIVLIVLNIVGMTWLLWWTSRKPKDGPGPETTGHVWDGDIREYNKPLPRWWMNLFYLTIVFAIGYLIWYPGLGNLAGRAGWTSAGEHDLEKSAADERLAEAFSRFEGQGIDLVAKDPEALAFGGRLFANHCAQCHGADARGARGFPNLTDADWQWGGTPDDILQTVLHGRQAAMPALGAAMGGDIGMTEVATYVQTLSGLRADPALAAAGKARFAGICAGCHGPEGRGNPLVGAPNLTDETWLYAPDFATIRDGVAGGRNGMMPAHLPILGETRARLVAAYVWSLSAAARDAPASAPAGHEGAQ